jgi:magnesium transporter
MEWHDIRDPNDPELDRLAERYKLHPLHVEDCRHRNQAAKIEGFDGYMFIVLKPIEVSDECELDLSDLDLFLGRDFLITVQEGGNGAVRRILDQARANWMHLRPDQVLYRTMDGIVDSYAPILDHFNETIDALEDKVLADPQPADLAKIFATKRSLIQVRRVLGNTRDVVSHLQRLESELIGKDMWPFFRDVYDHVARSLDLVEIERDLLNGALDIYLSSVANRTNQVMKVLTVLGTIALPAIVVSGLFGMNVQGLPWKDHPHAFLIMTLLVAALSGALLLLLRLLRWF